LVSEGFGAGQRSAMPPKVSRLAVFMIGDRVEATTAWGEALQPKGAA